MKISGSNISDKEAFVLRPSVLPFLIMILIATGGFLSLVMNILYGSWSLRLTRIALICTLALTTGMLLSLFAAVRLPSKTPPFLLFTAIFFIISGITLTGFLYIFFMEPVFFVWGSPAVRSFILMNFIFAFSFSVLTGGFIRYQQMIANKENELQKIAGYRKEAEEKLYSSRISPHFLFNALNLITSLLDQPDLAEEAVVKLSDLLRFHLHASEKETTSLKEEFENIEAYLFIQKLRFGDKLRSEMIRDFDAQVPPLLLSPLVENAVKHNIRQVDELTVFVKAQRSEGELILSVFDSARALKPEMIGDGTGLSLTCKRTELAGGHFRITEGGAEIRLRETL